MVSNDLSIEITDPALLPSLKMMVGSAAQLVVIVVKRRAKPKAQTRSIEVIVKSFDACNMKAVFQCNTFHNMGFLLNW